MVDAEIDHVFNGSIICVTILRQSVSGVNSLHLRVFKVLKGEKHQKRMVYVCSDLLLCESIIILIDIEDLKLSRLH